MLRKPFSIEIYHSDCFSSDRFIQKILGFGMPNINQRKTGINRALFQVFKVDDIVTFWLAISGIIRVKTSPFSLCTRKISDIAQKPVVDCYEYSMYA
jgi:hypothetical protein